MDNAKTFLNKLAEDKGLQAALIAAAQTAVTKEEKVAATAKVANEAGFAVSADELQKMVESIQTESEKLSDDDLDQVAGGRRCTPVGGAIGGAFYDATEAAVGAVGDATGAVGGAAEDVGRAVGGAAEDAGRAIASVFSGW